MRERAHVCVFMRARLRVCVCACARLRVCLSLRAYVCGRVDKRADARML